MLDSGFARFLPQSSRDAIPMNLTNSRSLAIYGPGYVALFVLFGLLYRHAYRKRKELGRQPLEVFDAKALTDQQVVSDLVGVVVVLIAVAAPRRYAFISPMAFILMWPGHALDQSRVKKKRLAFEGQFSLDEIAPSLLPSQTSL